MYRYWLPIFLQVNWRVWARLLVAVHRQICSIHAYSSSWVQSHSMARQVLLWSVVMGFGIAATLFLLALLATTLNRCLQHVHTMAAVQNV